MTKHIWDVKAGNIDQKGKRIQRQTISLQHMLSWKSLYPGRLNYLSLKQEIWAGEEMPPRKQVFHGSQSEEASLHPFLNLNICNQ